MRLLLSIVGNAIALFATTVVGGITFTGSWVQLLVAGAIFGLLNFFVRPLALLLSLPALVLTLGLFYFVLNALLLWAFSNFLPGYTVSGFIPALLGSLVLMVVNWVLHALFGGKKD
jgi:putative membrane protein